MLFFSDTNGEEYALLEDGWKGLSLGRIGTILNDVGPLKAVQDGSDLRENDLLKMEWKLVQNGSSSQTLSTKGDSFTETQF